MTARASAATISPPGAMPPRAPGTVPGFGRMLWRMLPAAVALHAGLVAVALLAPEAPAGGGGGKVLSRVNIALGTPDPAPVAPQPPVIEPPVPQPSVAQPSTSRPLPPEPAEARKAVRLPSPAAARPRPAPRKAEPAPRKAPTPSRIKETPGAAPSKAGARVTGAGAQAPVAGAGGGQARPADAADSYLQLVRSLIEEHRTYPRRARRMGIEGTVTVHIAIGADGALHAVSVASSAGAGDLDRAALRMVRAAAPFPVPPGGPMQLRLPIRFALER